MYVLHYVSHRGKFWRKLTLILSSHTPSFFIIKLSDLLDKFTLLLSRCNSNQACYKRISKIREVVSTPILVLVSIIMDLTLVS